jgi:formylglycine-generating enzyme required for sulfatase activity
VEAKICQNFDLRIAQIEESRYRVSVESQFGKASSEFRMPFSELDLDAFVRSTGRPRGVSRHIGSAEQEKTFSTRELGALLYDAIFTGVTADCLRGSLLMANQSNAGVRIRLDLTEAPNLINLPWEFLYDRAANRFLSLSVETPITRRLPTKERIAPLAATQPLRVLIMISSPQDYPRLDVDQEWTRLQNAVADLERRGLIQIERMQTATLAELQRRLRQQEYHIFHFVGHGGFDEQKSDGVLVLEDELHMGKPASATFLGTLLYDAKTIRLVVLNACEGGRTSHVDPFAGAAQGLLRQGVPAAVAMQFEITDRAAIIFSHEFYAAIADGLPVDSAVVEARKAIYADQNIFEWGTPVLYLNTPDGRVFEIGVPDSGIVAPPIAEDRAEVSLSSRPSVRAKDRLAQRLFAAPDSIGFRVGRYSAILAMIALALATDSGIFAALLLGLLYLSVSSTTHFQNLAGLIWLIALVGLLALQGQVQRLGAGDLVLGVAFLSLFVLIFVLATLVFVRPVTRGYRVALAGAGLGIGSTLLLLIADPLAAAPIVQATEPYAMIFFCVLVAWRAIDSARRNLAMTWRDTYLVFALGNIAMVWTIVSAFLNGQVVLGHVINVVASLMIIRGGMRNIADAKIVALAADPRQTEKRPSLAASSGQTRTDNSQGLVQEENPASTGVETLIIEHPIYVELVRVSAGEFLMGSDPSRDAAARPDEQPQHRLYLPQFYFGKHPVTNQQYATFVKATGHHIPEQWPGGTIPPRMELHPITHVSRQNAFAFCDWLSRETGFSFRLPTEAEWEKAARGSDGRLHPWGDDLPTPDRCNFHEANINSTTSVDSFVDDASPFGALDMLGNVMEWTGSVYRIDGAVSFGYPYAPNDGREILRGEGDFELVQRGGSYLSGMSDLRCARRFVETHSQEDVGFRVAITLYPTTVAS